MNRFACFLMLGLSALASAQIEEAAKDADVNDLCKNRPSNEYFRLTTEGDCRDVVRCDRAGLAGVIRLASIKCPNSLAFDLEKQTCDWKASVNNCDRLSKPRLVKPNFKTPDPVCPDGQLQVSEILCYIFLNFYKKVESSR